jgi:D-psicose/D-tagatose/L-ribulose 3-epimerase
VNRLEQAAALVRQINSPAVRTMFDVHNTEAETLSAPKLIRQYLPIIRHVLLNEMDGRRPGAGSYNFRELFHALQAGRYAGWCSLEVFNFLPSGEVVAREALQFLQSQIAG